MSDENLATPVWGSRIVETSHISVTRDSGGRVLCAARTEVDLDRYPEFRAFTDTPPAERGRIAAIAGDSEDDCPYSDEDTTDRKEWLLGFREASR